MNPGEITPNGTKSQRLLYLIVRCLRAAALSTAPDGAMAWANVDATSGRVTAIPKRREVATTQPRTRNTWMILLTYFPSINARSSGDN